MIKNKNKLYIYSFALMKKVVVFTGAGISAESGLGTFRSKEGVWEKYKIEDVATPDAFINNPAKVLEFYHPIKKKNVSFSVNVPFEFQKLLDLLNKYNG